MKRRMSLTVVRGRKSKVKDGAGSRRTGPGRRGTQKEPKLRVYPIILAAGNAARLGFPQALARFGKQTALEIAVQNCAGLARSIVVLGCRARELRAAVPHGARAVIHRGWRAGQLSSLLAGLRHVPRNMPFLLYPVDYPLLTPAVLAQLLRAFAGASPQHTVFLPAYGRRKGHPVLFSPEMREELRRARTAHHVVEADPGRVQTVPVRTAAIVWDFDSPASLRKCLRAWMRRRA